MVDGGLAGPGLAGKVYDENGVALPDIMVTATDEKTGTAVRIFSQPGGKLGAAKDKKYLCRSFLYL